MPEKLHSALVNHAWSTALARALETRSVPSALARSRLAGLSPWNMMSAPWTSGDSATPER